MDEKSWDPAMSRRVEQVFKGGATDEKLCVLSWMNLPPRLLVALSPDRTQVTGYWVCVSHGDARPASLRWI